MSAIGSNEHQLMEHVHERLGEILAGPGFYGLELSWYERISQAWRGLVSDVLAWLVQNLADIGGAVFIDGAWLIGALALVALLFIMAFTFRTARRGWVREGRGGYWSAPSSAAQMDPDSLLRHAARARDEGDYKEAIRYVYQACLARLASSGVLSIEPHATNWEYLRQARKLPHDRFQPFSQLTRLFEQIWYGDEPAGDDDYETGRALARAIFE